MTITRGNEHPEEHQPMTDSERLAYVREKIAEHAHDVWIRWMRYMLDNLDKEHLTQWRRQTATPYSELSEVEKRSDRNIANEYLSLKDDQGNPLIAVLAENQSLPGIPRGVSYYSPSDNYYNAQEALIKVGFRRVIL